MRIEQMDFFYYALDTIQDIGDGSQDALLVRVVLDDGSIGFGECEASPLTSIAAWCCPMSHSACHPLKDTVSGFTIDSAEDIFALTDKVRSRSFDLLQADHTLSGIDIALWDAFGKHCREPVWKLLGYSRAFAKRPYASQLFGLSPQETFRKAQRCREQGFSAAKFGWGVFGRDLRNDCDHIVAAREGLGSEADLMIDAGTCWVADVDAAAARSRALVECRVLWLEEPFRSGALPAYAEFGARCPQIKVAAGEGAHDDDMARNMIDFARLAFVQIDTGRIGGISTAFRVAEYAQRRGVQYVNHTFTSPLALSASLQPYAGIADAELCEYPTECSLLARAFTKQPPVPDADGMLRLPEAPGLGIEVDLQALEPYRRAVEIRFDGQTIWSQSK